MHRDHYGCPMVRKDANLPQSHQGSEAAGSRPVLAAGDGGAATRLAPPCLMRRWPRQGSSDEFVWRRAQQGEGKTGRRLCFFEEVRLFFLPESITNCKSAVDSIDRTAERRRSRSNSTRPTPAFSHLPPSSLANSQTLASPHGRRRRRPQLRLRGRPRRGPGDRSPCAVFA
jgi:hypothetical protein